MPLFWTVLLLALISTPGQCQDVNKDTCSGLTDPVFLKTGRLPTTALASFQGSGNTWVRQILAGSTGYKSGDIYKSYGDDIYPEFTSHYDDSVIAIKTHTYSAAGTCEYKFKRVLLIVRHPLDALYSEFNRMYGGNKTGYADIKQLVNADGSLTWKWDTWMTHVQGWLDFYEYWITFFHHDIHIIYYNNLKHDRYNELSKAIQFLGLKVDDTRLKCTIQYPKPAYFKRPDIPPPVEKHKLFRLAVPKANKAIAMLENMVLKRFGEESDMYRRRNLTISVMSLR